LTTTTASTIAHTEMKLNREFAFCARRSSLQLQYSRRLMLAVPKRITTSIAESVQAYKFEHGRRYHAYQDEIYALPNDDAEIFRLGGFG
jgi:hypothetical protein